MTKAVALLILAFATFISAASAQKTEGLEVHEWGTFTTLTRGDGRMMVWNPLGAPSELPKFVYRGAGRFKAELTGTVRMETPVVYFYTEKPMTVDIRVDFKSGVLTEWFPNATISPLEPTNLHWPRVDLLPGQSPEFPGKSEDGHYFAARDAKATPLRVTTGEPPVTEHEGYLFYRGVGSPNLPIEVRTDADGIRVKSLSDVAIPYIVFRNTDGKCAYGVYGAWREKNDMCVPYPGKESIRWDDLDHAQGLEKLLIDRGLEEAEAKAMIKTWKNDWFEPGLRVFWIVPQKSVDEFLPLTIEPKPTAIKRVFVGRVEILTKEFENAVEKAIDQALAEKYDELEKLGRFARPFVEARAAKLKPGGDEMKKLARYLDGSK